MSQPDITRNAIFGSISRNRFARESAVMFCMIASLIKMSGHDPASQRRMASLGLVVYTTLKPSRFRAATTTASTDGSSSTIRATFDIFNKLSLSRYCRMNVSNLWSFAPAGNFSAGEKLSINGSGQVLFIGGCSVRKSRIRSRSMSPINGFGRKDQPLFTTSIPVGRPEMSRMFVSGLSLI